MTLQAKLQIEYNNHFYTVAVKSIVLKGVYYFFINDNGKDPAFLSGRTLELVYTNDFAPSAKESTSDNVIAPEKVSAIKNTLLLNKQLWYS